MKQQLQNLWFKSYDEDTLSKEFHEIDFEKYVMIVVTDPNFQYFEQHALDNRKYWDRSLSIHLDLLDEINLYFDPSTLDQKVIYIENQFIKKITGKFRFWIDCQRLYCIQFFYLDDNLFNDDRCIMSLFRIKKAFLALFKAYKCEMFEQNQFNEFCQRFKQVTMNLQKTFNKEKKVQINLANQIVMMFNKFTRNEFINEKQLLSEGFKKVSKEIIIKNSQVSKKIEFLLFNKIQESKKITQQGELQIFNQLPVVHSLINQIRYTYDPTYIEMMEKKQKQQAQIKKSRKIILFKQKQPQVKSRQDNKNERASTKKFSLQRFLQKTQNNPLSNKNTFFNIFINGISKEDLPNELLNKDKQQADSTGDQNIDEQLFYDQLFISEVKNASRNIAKIQRQDLLDIIKIEGEAEKQKQNIAMDEEGIKVRNFYFKNYSKQEANELMLKPKGNLIKTDQNLFKQNFEDKDSDSEQIIEKVNEKKNFLTLLKLQEQKSLNQNVMSNHTRNRFNVYQIKHVRQSNNWGIVRSIFYEMKTNKKMERLKKKPTNQIMVSRGPEAIRRKLAML